MADDASVPELCAFCRWQWLNQAAEPKAKAPFAFTQGELVDELVELFVRGRYSRTEACQILAALKGEEGGAR